MIAFIRSVSWQREAFIFACAIITFAFTGPFGTYDDLSFFERLIYWSVSILGCGVFFWTIMYQTIYRPMLARFPKLIRLAIGAAIAAVPASAVVYYLQITMRHIPVPSERLPWLWFVVLFVGIGIGVIYFISPFGRFLQPEHQNLTSSAKSSAKSPAAMPLNEPIGKAPTNDFGNHSAFFERLPDDLGRELVSLSMNDHYVEVVTTLGKAMLHMKFADAMVELADYPGVRIHRSHWVAIEAATSIVRRGRSYVVSMQDGHELPVSDTYKNAALALDNSSVVKGSK